MYQDYPVPIPRVLLDHPPAARALLRGSDANPGLAGEVLFYPFQGGSLLLIRIAGLEGDGFFGFHIHTTGDCCTGGDMAFHCAGGHYDPEGGVPHPNHAGDLPVLLANDGRVFAVIYTGRFTPVEVVGRSVILHDKPDDYRSQPAGDSGARIACGIIEPVQIA